MAAALSQCRRRQIHEGLAHAQGKLFQRTPCDDRPTYKSLSLQLFHLSWRSFASVSCSVRVQLLCMT